MKIGRGLRPKKPEECPDVYWELIQDCWKQLPSERLTFDQIIEKLKDDKYALEEYGVKTDLDQLHEYQERIKNSDNEKYSTIILETTGKESFEELSEESQKHIVKEIIINEVIFVIK